MSAAINPGKLKLGAEPKKLALLGLFLVIALVLWIRAYTSSGDVPASPPPASATETAAASKNLPIAEPPVEGQAQARARHRSQNTNDRGALKIRYVDPTHGDIDPTLRLDLLERLGSVKMAGAGRSLFTMGTQPITPAEAAKIKAPTIIPTTKPNPAAAVAQGPPPVAPIALKFYGYIRPATPGAPRRGFFLDGDVILVATEGEILKQHYRIISLKENRATFEDTATKTQQDVALTPEAHEN